MARNQRHAARQDGHQSPREKKRRARPPARANNEALAPPVPHEHPAAALRRAMAAPPRALRPADILALQRTVGNHAVQRIVAATSAQIQRRPVLTHFSWKLILRKKKRNKKKDAVRAAHIRAGAWLGGALTGLGTPADRARYRRWFGAPTPARVARVRQVLTQTRAALQGDIDYRIAWKTYTFSRGTFAYVYTTNPGVVWLARGFFASDDTPNEIIDSTTGTLIHEVSHYAANTDDVDDTYGTGPCRQLALTSPDDAVENADNSQYYCESAH